MKTFSKRLLSIFLSILMIVSIVPMGTITAQAGSFSPRLSSPAKTGWYANYVNNCCTYAKCRASEILGRTVYIGTNGPGGYYDYCARTGAFSVGSYPKVGALAVASGHIFVVEAIEGNTLTISEGHSFSEVTGASYWNVDYGRDKGAKDGTWFCNRKITYNVNTGRPNSNIIGTWKGYIYIYNGEGGTSLQPPNSGSPANDTHYDSNASKSLGTYLNTCNSGVNMRYGVGTNADKIGCTVPKNAEVYVYETNGNWGKITYAGREGWVCLDYFTKVNIPVPATPSVSNISSDDIAVGKSVTVSWNGVSGADSYTIGIRSNHVNQDINVGNATSYSYILSYAEKYDFYVKASNVSGASNWSSSRSCTAHDPVTVQFVDWDDSDLGTQIIDYGSSAVAPAAPERKGYTFQGWSDSYYNVTSNKTIKATYKINTYIVNFFDREGTLIDSQKVTYGSDATPPTDTHENGKYVFLGWNSTDYIDVYTDRADKNINIDGIYTWYNYDLPTVCTIKSATRQYDGYYVTFDIENNDSLPTTGRAVVALKTAEGKLVDMTESTAFSIPAGKTKNGIEVFIPCNKVASSVEVFMVSDYSSGVPISPSVSSEVEEGLMYAESTVKPENSDGTLDILEVTQYSYRDKEFSTGNTKSKEGWEWDGTRSEKLVSQSGWIDNTLSTYDNESEKRIQVNTQSVPVYAQRWKYCYLHYYKPNNGNHTWCPNGHAYGTEHAIWINYPLEWYKYSTCGGLDLYRGYACPNCGASNYWWYYAPSSGNETYIDHYKTQYWYNTYQYSYNFYRWKNWTDWSDTAVTSSENRDVRTRTVYRYKSNNIQPEDNSGKVRNIEGTLDSSFAGKQITMYVYGYTGASDYTNQYIGQSVVEEDGSYSFSFKLREEPTVETGDFTVAIGIEGTSDLTIVDTIEAPVPTYTVNFYDWDGSIISTQTVEEGEDAVLPENPEKEGYNFVGWDKSVSNIRQDTDFFADFRKKEFTVVFVDWENQQIEIKKFACGDALTAPEAEAVEGYTFVGWDSESTIVTQDMIVTAQYEQNEYTVKFYDWNNEVIDTQTVKYGETAVVPDDPEEDGVVFADWFNPEDYQYVDHDVAIYPTYYFEETTSVPTSNYNTGEYDENIQLKLESDDPNAVIYYYFNEDESTERIYTSPITIDKTCSVTYYATSFGKNNSDTVTSYYCINTSDKPSEWMTYPELPDDVKNNLSDYDLESEVGYKYKDISNSSKLDEIADYEAEGWTLEKTTYTDYTEWQDEEIVIDDNLLGFEVDTQETDDPTVRWYQYSHYKYTDGDGTVKYSPTFVDGFDCEYETVTLENRLSIAGFTEDSISYYNYDGQIWYSQIRVNGKKTQYRSRYKVAEYYKWTDWGIEPPSSNDKREYQSDTVYRYSNKNYHLVFTDYHNMVLMVEEGKEIDTNRFVKLGGYDFTGLYIDSDLTIPFDLSTPITESITLFTKYTPKKYTVTFQMQDGTELDTQQVEYQSSAVAPATDVVPGYVFGGWDKDFDCITEDTVITGKYFKESEYTRVSLDKNKASAFSGTTFKLIAAISPSNLVNEQIEWTTSDPSVASVDENGNVTAVSQGVATITCTAVKTKETATCEVTVTQDLATGILLKSESNYNHDSLGYLRNVKLETSAEKALQQFANSDLKVFDINGLELLETDTVGTGSEIRLYNGDKIVDKEVIVITGDMTGDGIINNRDVAMMNKLLVDKVIAAECQELAIDVNGDGFVNNKDAAMVARYLVGKENF